MVVLDGLGLLLMFRCGRYILGSFVVVMLWLDIELDYLCWILFVSRVGVKQKIRRRNPKRIIGNCGVKRKK